MAESTDRFTLSDYRSILDAARAHGYRFGRFTDPVAAPEDRVVYLRHDIDNCTESALLLAELEARAGAVSTYFAMVRSENYNPFAGVNARRLRRIRDFGHEIGLHFASDEHELDALANDLGACIRADARLLGDAVEAPVCVFSFHNPTESGPFTVEVPGLVNAYADRFFAHAHYLSESNMRWRYGSPVEALAVGDHRVVQILVHPLSYRDDFRSDRDVLLWFIRNTARRLLELNVGQNRVLREQSISLADVAAYIAQGEDS